MSPRNKLAEIERLHRHPRAIPNVWKLLAAALPRTEEDEIMEMWLEARAERTAEELEAERIRVELLSSSLPLSIEATEMPRDTHVEPEIETAIEAAPYRELLVPAYCDDVFKDIEPRTPAGQRFAAAGTLHELLRLALDDFAAISRDERYIVDVGGGWHAPISGEQTSLCLAGAVIARSLGAPIGLRLEPDDYTFAVARRLEAINQLRLGDVVGALMEIGSIGNRVAAEEISRRFAPLLRRFLERPANRKRAPRLPIVLRRMQVELAAAGL